MLIFAPVLVQLLTLGGMVIVMLRGLSINNLLGFRGLMHSDLVSLSLLILTFWLTALMVSSQFLARYKNGLILIFLFLKSKYNIGNLPIKRGGCR